ncbi:MAG: bifunctional transaldolase/phosoglucose isomerase [Chloroflexi bacterium]|nr:bifunctional transaldolase/phosoglucose isomerase [Chloroflexota bacterium]
MGSRNPLRGIEALGQSVWIDYLRRTFVTEGDLQRLVQEDGLKGLTSNPAIFEKAIAGSTDYASALAVIQRLEDQDPMAIYEQLAIEDIQMAANALRPVYDATNARDGYASLEVSPHLARDTEATVAEARRLWMEIRRPNVMIKVPASNEGLAAITDLIGEGINVNVTLLFALERYEQVAEAYVAGLERFAERGGDLASVASVASFFVSRVDSAVDALLDVHLKSAATDAERSQLSALMGAIAIANAKLAYQRYQLIFRGARWEALVARGAQTQRLLWASTGTKNPAYSDVRYLEELIGPDTVNTVPPTTLDAFRDHGVARLSLTEKVDEAAAMLVELERAGISMKEVTDKLFDEGVVLFADAFDKLLGAVARQREGVLGRDREIHTLPADLSQAVDESLEEWRRTGRMRQLWAGDASVWTGADEASWLGWLRVAEDELARAFVFSWIADDIQEEGFTDALLLGMGGSSLCPEVMANTFGPVPGYPRMHVLDSTDPEQIARVESGLDLARTVVIVSSKSGTTLEPNILKDYFFERMKQTVGPEAAPSHFIAITDPGSKLQEVAEHEGFRHVFFGHPSIGGRYSALSDFGMVPAAVAGVDVRRFLESAEIMVHSCARSLPPQDNPAAVLGIILGVGALQGRNKVTIVASPGIAGLGSWLEQLLAESTGKQGKGLIPVDGEPLGPPDVYGQDRIFAYLRLETGPDAAQDQAIEALEQAGQPVVRITVDELYDLGQEFFRWELATAVAGSILGINAFDQPDVEDSKEVTRALAERYEATGSLPAETPLFEDGGVTLFADPRNAEALRSVAGPDQSLAGYLRAHLDRLGAGDYFALLAYLDRNEAHESVLQSLRQSVRDRKRVASVLGFGPRFLHSTGQAYKGGPNSGVFLQVTADAAKDLPVPGHRYTFGVVKAAQARGDFQVLAERGRRALRVHLRGDVMAGLERLKAAAEQAFGG